MKRPDYHEILIKPTSVFLASAAVVLAVLQVAADAAHAQDPQRNELAIKAREILNRYCTDCHGNVEQPKAKLNVIDHEKLIKSGIVVPKEPEKSKLILRISSKDEERMPPLDKTGLSNLEIKLLRDWISVGAPAPEQAPQEVITARVKDLFRNRCDSCHSGTSPAARLDIFNAADMRQRKIVHKGEDADSSPLLHRLLGKPNPSDRMPPKGLPLSDDEINLVRTWILGGAPDFEVDLSKNPANLGREYIYQQILSDVKKKGDEAANYRYFSFNHLIAAGITKDDMKAHEQALAITINHLTWASKPERLEAIDDPLNSIFKVNIRNLGWLDKQFDDATDVKKIKKSDFTLFDLVLLEYPYGVVATGNQTYLDLVDKFLKPANQVRPIVYLRGDWFVCMALQAPLYEDLLKLPRKLETLEKQLLHIDSETALNNVANNNVRRAGMTESGVSRNNRIVERYTPTKQFRHYWKSYDYANSTGSSNILAKPDTRKADGGEMIWSLPNGMQAYFVCDSAGRRITAAPTNIVVDRHASDKIVRNGLGCIRCHGSGIQNFDDVVRPAVLNLQANPPDFDRLKVLALYPDKNNLDEIIAADRAIFQNAIKEILGETVNVTEVLGKVTKRYLDDAIRGNNAIAELGVADPDLKNAFKGAAFVVLGISQLAIEGGRIRRDAWEANHDRIVESLNLGLPLVNHNGLNQLNFEPRDKVDVDMKINRTELDKAELVVKNTGKNTIFIEVVLQANDGQMVLLSDGVEELKVGGDGFRFPADKTEFMKVTPDALVDHVTLYASEKKFDPGVVLKLKKSNGENTSDRFVHNLGLRVDKGRVELIGDSKNVLKRTIEAVTR